MRLQGRKTSKIIFSVAAAAGLAFFALRAIPGAQAIPQKADDAPKSPLVFVSAAKTAELSEALSYPARVVPKVNATVLSEVDGLVSKISRPLGTQVNRGRLLMTIRHTDPVYEYAPVPVPAPVTGVVSQIYVTEGSRVVKGQRIATVTDPTSVRIEVEVPALDLEAMVPGLLGELKIRGRDEAYPVRVRGVGPFVDPASGTSTCEIELAPAEGKSAPALPPGLMGQVGFKAFVHQGLSVPDYAITYKGKDTFVKVVEGGKARFAAVTLGKSRRGSVEILKGLNAGAQIIERASSFVGDGDAVTVQPPEGKTL